MTIDVEINRDYFSGELQDLAKIQKKVVNGLRDALDLRTTVNLVTRVPCPGSREKQSASWTEGLVPYDESVGLTD